jgi:methylase of polypeptide subunit release factors
MPHAEPLTEYTATDVDRLRSALWSAGYDADGVGSALGSDEATTVPPPSQVSVVRRRLPPGKPLSTLVELFLLGLRAPHSAAAKALKPLSLDAAVAMGLLRDRGDDVEAGVRIVPHAGLLLACSHTPETRAVDANHVMGVTPSSLTLANLTMRPAVELAVDIGTGCGVQALLAARHCARVIAVDINPVALRFAEFNARLNRIDNIECRLGSYFEPVQNEDFDLIVSNPPFVISPETRFLYRDSELAGDEVSRAVVTEAPAHLRRGGWACIMVSWVRRDRGAWSRVPEEWLSGLGCDAWLLHHSSQTPLAYAGSWTHVLDAGHPDRQEKSLQRWLEYFEGLGVDSIGYGAVLLRRRDGATWTRAEDIPQDPVGPAGEQLGRLTASQDFLDGLPDQASLLDVPLVATNGHRLEQVLRPRAGGYAVERATLHLEQPLPFVANVDAFNILLLARLDGRHTVREAIRETAAGSGRLDVGVDQIEAATLPVVRRMVELGFAASPDN